MADTLRDRLASIHEAVAASIEEDLNAEPVDPEDMESVVRAMERRARARRDAMQLLKQNGITAPVEDETPMDNIRKKLDFSAVSQKVVPLRERSTGG